MLYKDFLKTLTTCPFCEPPSSRILQKNDASFLTYSIAPYHKHHLMVIPDRHVENFKDLNEVETRSIDRLLRKGANLLSILGYKDYTILLKNGQNDGKSITHLHYHIIPVAIIGDIDHKGEERKVINEDEINQLISDFKEAELNT